MSVPRRWAYGIIGTFFVVHMYAKLGVDPYVDMLGGHFRVRERLLRSSQLGGDQWPINQFVEHNALTVLAFIDPPDDAGRVGFPKLTGTIHYWAVREVSFIGVFERLMPDDETAFSEQYEGVWRMTDEEGYIAARFSVSARPTAVVLDDHMRVVQRVVGEDQDLAPMLHKILLEQP